MSPKLREAYLLEIAQAKAAERQGELEVALERLARAHILSQRYALAHASVHLRMLRLGWRLGDWREMRGQVGRSVAALVFSRIWVPIGNTGRANVSAFMPMPVPEDLAPLLEE